MSSRQASLLVIIMFCLGGIAGGSFVHFILEKNSSPSAKTSSNPSPAVTPDVSPASKGEIQRLKEENARLTAQITDLRKKPETAATEASTDSSSRRNDPAQWADNMVRFAQSSISRRADTDIAALKLRLKFDDAQEAAIRQIYKKQQDDLLIAAEKFKNGELSRDEIRALFQRPADFDQQLKQVLNAQQVAEYDKYQTEQNQFQAETRANNQLLGLNRTLSLNQTQQDEVFKALYQQNLTRNTTDREARDAALLVTMKKILTPDQFAVYEKQQTNQRQGFDGWRGRGRQGSSQTTPSP